MKPRIIAFIDHEIGFRILRRLISLSITDSVELVAAVTTSTNGKEWWPGVQGLCEKSGIPLFFYTTPFKDVSSFENIDWYLLLSWKYVIPAELLAAPRHGVINLHFSLLPENRGGSPVNWAIIEGKQRTGITYHYATERIDGGDIIVQAEAPIMPDDTARTLLLRLNDLAYDNFDDVLLYMSTNKRAAFSKSKTEQQSSYRPVSDFKEKCKIDLEATYRAGDFLNLLRGMTFFPESNNAFFIDNATGKKIYVSLNLREEK